MVAPDHARLASALPRLRPPSATDQYEQCSNQPHGAGVDAGQVIGQPPGYQAEVSAIRGHASLMNLILGKFPRQVHLFEERDESRVRAKCREQERPLDAVDGP